MNAPTTPRSDLRELGRSAIRTEIAQRAIVLLDEQGFDQTTVDDISTAVGISPRSFFRYFPTKEDLVIGDLMPMGRLVEQALLDRPEDESPWVALRAALVPLVLTAEKDPEDVLRNTRVALSTAGLRAKTIERHTAWAALLAPIIAQRLPNSSRHTAMAADALSQSALACLYVATVTWSSSDRSESYANLLDAAFSAVAPL